MSTTIDTMSVVQARQLLRNTSSVPPERVDEAERAISAFYAASGCGPAVPSLLLYEVERASYCGRWCILGVLGPP